MRETVLAALILFTVGAVAEEPTLVGPVTLDRSEQYHFVSEAVGDVFSIDVILPIG